MIKTLPRTLLALALVAGLTLATATAAQAHNVLLKTNPATGSSVARLPTTVVLTFNLPALNIGAAMEIVGPKGDVASGKPVLVNTTVSEAVQPGAPAGAYLVTWRITSADGHPISGTFPFTAQAGDGGTAPSPTAQPLKSSETNSNHVALIAVLIVLLILVLLAVLLAALLALRRRRDAHMTDQQ